jgi:hypothetical protein
MRATTLAAWLLLAASGAAQSPDFPARHVASANAPLLLRQGELDGDGTGDFALILSGDKLSVQFGQPAGGIGPPANKVVGTDPQDLAIGLLDGDALPDIVSANRTSQDLSLVYGLGGGALEAAQSLPVAAKAMAVALGDLQGDGITDILLGEDIPAAGAGGALRAWLGDGAGGFAQGAGAALPVGWSPYRVLTGSLDGNAAVDTVVLCQGGPVVVRGLGNGGFEGPVVLPSPGGLRDAGLADLDADGDLDLVACAGFFTTADGLLVTWIGDGLGGFALSPIQLATGPTPLFLTLADADLDGDTDAFACSQLGDVTLLPNPGDGLFAAGARHDVPRDPVGLAVQDATGDGLPDILTVSSAGFSVVRADGAGGFLGIVRGDSESPRGVVAADMNHDGAPDLVTWHATNAKLAGLLLADGAGGWLPEVTQSLPADGTGLDTGDVTGDGHPDVAVAATFGVPVLAGNGAGALAPAVENPFPGLYVYDVGLSDLDLDGRADALVACSTNTLPFTGSLRVLAGTATGQLALAASFPAGGDGDGTLETGDLDGDGLDDVVLSMGQSEVLSTLRALGGFQFAPAQVFALPDRPSALALGDLDLDGALDAAVVSGVYDTLTLAPGDGVGGFMPGAALAFGHQLTGVRVADVTGDGWPDVLTGWADHGAFEVRANDGAGGLAAGVAFLSTADWVYGLTTADLDGDARPDVVLVDDGQVFTAGEVIVSRNASDPFTWSDLGAELPGTLGAPRLHGTGALLPGSPGDLRLFHARPSSLAVLFVAATSAPAAFKGGTLVPVPPIAQIVVVTDAAGALTLGWSAWPSASPDQDWYFQYGVADPAGVHGVALSNALRAVEP